MMLAPERLDIRVVYAVALFRLNCLVQTKTEFLTLCEANL